MAVIFQFLLPGGIAIFLLACSQFMPPAGAVNAPAAGGKGQSCEHNAVIEDGEDGDGRALVREGRGGYWYTYVDKAGSRVQPAPNAFKMAKIGARSSKGAIRFQGKLSDKNDSYAGLGISFVNPKRIYNASRYEGVSFLAKRGNKNLTSLRLKLPDANTDPDAGNCKECYNDFGVDFQLTDSWTRYVVAFADLEQETGWGNPQPDHIDPKNLYGIQWQFSTPGSQFDIWIDDISFVGCP